MSEATLAKGINALKAQIDAPVAAFFSSCVHCGMCADACLFYTETGDPQYTPIYKLEPLKRLWRQEYTVLGKLSSMLGLSKPLSDEELSQWETLVYDSCSLCGRCSMVCPVGNDIAYMVRKIREGFAAAGHAPEGLIGAAERAIKVGSPMNVTWKTVQAQIAHVEKESGETVPVDQQGADYLVLMSSMEVVNFPEYLSALVKIFKKAGVSWTLSHEAFEATNTGIQIGVSDIAGELIERIVKGAEKLQVKYVISPECGHAYTAIRYEAPGILGKKLPFKVIHILELLDQLREQGKLTMKDKDQRKLTYHDPCQITRRGGVVQQPRNLLAEVANNFVEMPDSGIQNWCCGGGGGISSNERADEIRLKVFNKKKTQLEAVKPDTLVTACANCRIMLEDGLEAYQVDLPVIGLTELLAEHLEEKE